MSEEKMKTAVEWLAVPPYDGVFMDSPDGWDRKNLIDFNTKKITETEFREKLKQSNARVPELPTKDAKV